MKASPWGHPAKEICEMVLCVFSLPCLEFGKRSSIQQCWYIYICDLHVFIGVRDCSAFLTTDNVDLHSNLAFDLAYLGDPTLRIFIRMVWTVDTSGSKGFRFHSRVRCRPNLRPPPPLPAPTSSRPSQPHPPPSPIRPLPQPECQDGDAQCR